MQPAIESTLEINANKTLSILRDCESNAGSSAMLLGSISESWEIVVSQADGKAAEPRVRELLTAIRDAALKTAADWPYDSREAQQALQLAHGAQKILTPKVITKSERVQSELAAGIEAIVLHLISSEGSSGGLDDLLAVGKGTRELGDAAQFLLFEYLKDGLCGGLPASIIDKCKAGDPKAVEPYAKWCAKQLTRSINLEHFKS
jgi:hypothetical protein